MTRNGSWIIKTCYSGALCTWICANPSSAGSVGFICYGDGSTPHLRAIVDRAFTCGCQILIITIKGVCQCSTISVTVCIDIPTNIFATSDSPRMSMCKRTK